MNIRHITTKVLSVAILSVAMISNAHAINQSITASVGFVSPLSISNVINASFGNVTAGVGSTSYVLDTNDAINVASGSGTLINGTPRSASFTINGSAGQTINISAGSYTANGGVTPSAATCKYGSGSQVPCADSSLDNAAAPGASGTQLKMGLTITTTGNESDGATASPSFTVTVVYN